MAEISNKQVFNAIVSLGGRASIDEVYEYLKAHCGQDIDRETVMLKLTGGPKFFRVGSGVYSIDPDDRKCSVRLSADDDHAEIHEIEQLYFYDSTVTVKDICRKFNVTQHYLKKKFGVRTKSRRRSGRRLGHGTEKPQRDIYAEKVTLSRLLDSEFDEWDLK
jgi:hypothetical protein